MIADVYGFSDAQNKDLQLFYYEKALQDQEATPWQRWYASQNVGWIHYDNRNYANARTAWEAALQYKQAPGLLGNLADLDERDGLWAEAQARYEQAEKILDDYKRSHRLGVLQNQEATLHSNWCNMFRNRAKSESGKDQTETRREAIAQCQLALAVSQSYLDAHWNLARVHLDSADFSAADAQLREVLRIIEDRTVIDPASLDENRYDRYGLRYTIWMLVATRFLSGQSLAGDLNLVKRFNNTVVRGGNAATEVKATLDGLEDGGLTVNDDRTWLQNMTEARYF